MAVLSLVFGILGNLISVGLFLSPAPTFRRIVRKKSTEEFSWLPYAAALMNCLLWVWYGLPGVKLNIPVLTINTFGSLLQLSYLAIFLRYSPAKNKMRISVTLTAIAIVEAVVVAVTIWALPGSSGRKLFVGILCVIFTTGMNVAPLSVMKLVIQSRSVEFMPFYLSLFVFINGCAWLMYGLLTSDVFVLIPNALGAFLGAMQLILYAVYSRATPKVAQKDSSNQLTGSDSKTGVELQEQRPPKSDASAPPGDSMV